MQIKCKPELWTVEQWPGEVSGTVTKAGIMFVMSDN